MIATTGSLCRILKIRGFVEEIYLEVDIPYIGLERTHIWPQKQQQNSKAVNYSYLSGAFILLGLKMDQYLKKGSIKNAGPGRLRKTLQTAFPPEDES